MFKFEAQVKDSHGTGASRRLRHQGKIPAIIYGGGQAPISIILDHEQVNNAQVKEGFYTSTITLVVDGKEITVKPQAVQRHAYKPKLLHIDFKRV